MPYLASIYIRLLNEFGINSFKARDVAEKLGFSHGYVRNVLGALQEKGWLSFKHSTVDKRVKFYRLELGAFDEVLSKTEAGEVKFVEALSPIVGDYVAFVDNEIVDHDRDLGELVKRLYNNFPIEKIYITNVGKPSVMIKIGF